MRRDYWMDLYSIQQEATTSANVGSYARPLGPIALTTPYPVSSVRPLELSQAQGGWMPLSEYALAVKRAPR